MKNTVLKLANTNKMLASARRGKYAVPAFNFYNMESLSAIIAAAVATKSPVILAVSESALKYMGPDTCVAMVNSMIPRNAKSLFALHLDHGHSYESCKHAIDIGFSSVMIDGSNLPFDDNVKLTKRVVAYAHKHAVSVEAELGMLAGLEDEATDNTTGTYTDPNQAAEFVSRTNCDSLAIAIGTSHGAYKRRNSCEHLRFDILKKIEKLIPKTPLVLHGASMIPQNLIAEINANGGKIKNAMGIEPAQIRRAIRLGITKVNVDSDARLAWTAAVRSGLSVGSSDFDPRKFLSAAREKMTHLYIDEIKKVMHTGKR